METRNKIPKTTDLFWFKGFGILEHASWERYNGLLGIERFGNMKKRNRKKLLPLLFSLTFALFFLAFLPSLYLCLENERVVS